MTRPLRVLLVEDNPGDTDLIRESLQSGKLHLHVSSVSDGVEALAFLRKTGVHADAETPDILLLDLNLPKLSGPEVLAEMKRDARLRIIPVVILTSSDAEADVLSSYKLGANCYVTKPVGLEAFQKIVRSVEEFWFTIVKLP